MDKAKRKSIAFLIFLVFSLVSVIILAVAYNHYYSGNSIPDNNTTAVSYKKWEKFPEDIPQDAAENLQKDIDGDFRAKSVVIN